MPARPAASDMEKPAAVSISSSSEQEEEESDSDDQEEEEEDDDDDDSDDEDYVDDDYDGAQEEEDDEGESDVGEEASSSNGDDDDEEAVDGKPTDDERCNKVIDFLKRKRSLDILKLEECKSYLRKYALRLSGTKTTCIKRILEHYRLKDGNGENLYPRSSFVINCTGDVCKGDVILFRQRVYDKFDKVTRSANIIGKRIIAGRVVKESYGAAKQQHTFTVEVLWCKGKKALPPLFPLLVKGRNLYRLKTFRQRWSNELERSKVLAEKHQRGAAARRVREISKAKSGKCGSRCQRSSSDARPHYKKRRMEEPKHASGIKKQKVACATALFDAHANAPATMTRNINSQKVPCVNAPFHAHANMQATMTGYANSSYAGPRQARYHESGIHPRCPIPERNSYNHDSTLMEFQHIIPPQTNRRNFHVPTYNADYSLDVTGVTQHHALNMERTFRHPYTSATPRVDPWIASQLWRLPDCDDGPTLPPGMQVHRFGRS